MPQDVTVEVVYGRLGVDHSVDPAGAIPMRAEDTLEDGLTVFKGVVPFVGSGRHGFSIRVVPRNRDLPNPFQMGLVKIYGG